MHQKSRKVGKNNYCVPKLSRCQMCVRFSEKESLEKLNPLTGIWEFKVETDSIWLCMFWWLCFSFDFWYFGSLRSFLISDKLSVEREDWHISNSSSINVYKSKIRKTSRRNLDYCQICPVCNTFPYHMEPMLIFIPSSFLSVKMLSIVACRSSDFQFSTSTTATKRRQITVR